MSLIPAHRQQHSLLPDFTDVWNSLAPAAGLASMFGTHLLRVEDTVDDGHYVVRAEIPGVDPDKDVEVSVRDGQLTIKAERSEKHEEKGRSEFSYGSFVRTVTLPQGADEDAIEASYAKGILTVSVPVAEPAGEAKKVQVKQGE
ncbi:Hsp20/alpha crystallin family protein [Nocardia flavorosea]|uniref:Hsp20/alpha crystallin family protein n=1 Tax=Nocardia flavorosea TaxID=53429 RepID=A0A846YNT3_9NOCA|nr:Hsp20/alpha crystallin family protein [Nocardia flavorosea]NKY59371.1 Hsp20/alpha crystallin family protein [Nocardia flavorosea]